MQQIVRLLHFQSNSARTQEAADSVTSRFGFDRSHRSKRIGKIIFFFFLLQFGATIVLLLVVHSHLPDKEWNGLDDVLASFVTADFFGKDMELGNDVEVIGGWISLLVAVEYLVVARNSVGELVGEIHSLERLVLSHRSGNILPFVRRIGIGRSLENESQNGLSQVTTIQKLGRGGARDYEGIAQWGKTGLDLSAIVHVVKTGDDDHFIVQNTIDFDFINLENPKAGWIQPGLVERDVVLEVIAGRHVC